MVTVESCLIYSSLLQQVILFESYFTYAIIYSSSSTKKDTLIKMRFKGYADGNAPLQNEASNEEKKRAEFSEKKWTEKKWLWFRRPGKTTKMMFGREKQLNVFKNQFSACETRTMAIVGLLGKSRTNKLFTIFFDDLQRKCIISFRRYCCTWWCRIWRLLNQTDWPVGKQIKEKCGPTFRSRRYFMSFIRSIFLKYRIRCLRIFFSFEKLLHRNEQNNEKLIALCHASDILVFLISSFHSSWFFSQDLTDWGTNQTFLSAIFPLWHKSMLYLLTQPFRWNRH